MSRPNNLVWQHRNPGEWSEVLGEVPLFRKSGIARSVTSLLKNHQDWEAQSQAERLARLGAWHDLLAARKSVWVDGLIRDVGKPVTDARAEVDYGLDLVKGLLGAPLEPPGHLARFNVRYHPHGLVGIITPWNNPFAISISKIAAALCFGNSVVWKPALPASALSAALHDSLGVAGLGGHVGLVTGDAMTGGLLVCSPEVRAIAFTGSIPVGQKIAQACGRLMRPFQGEMGGNNAAIVLADSDIEAVARELASAMFSFSGQRCTAIRRVIVEERVFRPFAKIFCEATNDLVIGLPGDSTTQIGPVISRQSQHALLDAVRQAVNEGGQLLAGAHLPSHFSERGCWIAPTVLSSLRAQSPVIQNELFGPVVALIPAKNMSHAITIHNDVAHGLLGALFSESRESQECFLNNAQAGMLILNHARPKFDRAAPFTGWKSSAFGPPEHGRWDRDFYAKVQTIYP